MMARPCVVALLCVALWCGVVAGQDAAAPSAPPAPEDPETSAGAGMMDDKTNATITTTTEGTAAGGDGRLLH